MYCLFFLFFQSFFFKTKVKFTKYFKKLRNTITKKIRQEKNYFQRKIINECQNDKDLNKVLKNIDSGFHSNFNKKEDFSVDGKKGTDLADGLVEFFKKRSENLVSDLEIENSDLKNLENNLENLILPEKQLKLEFPEIVNFNDFIKKKI